VKAASGDGYVRGAEDVCGKNDMHDVKNKPLFDPKVVHVHSLDLEEDVETELAEMQGRGIDINEFLREALKKRKENIEIEKTKLAEEQIEKCTRARDGSGQTENPQIKGVSAPSAGYMPVKIKKILTKEHGTKCSVPHCPKPAKTFHHTARFSLTYNHDPHFLAPLCEAHHEIAHKIDIKYVEAVKGSAEDFSAA